MVMKTNSSETSCAKSPTRSAERLARCSDHGQRARRAGGGSSVLVAIAVGDRAGQAHRLRGAVDGR